MFKSWAMGSVLALSALSTARAACDALGNNLDVPSPLTEDTTITLSVGVIDCPALDVNTNRVEVEQVVVEGGTLTIKSDNAVQFINVAFLVMPGAALVFDMPETLFGPNDRSGFDFPRGTLLEVREGTSLTFNGDLTIQEVSNVNIVIENAGDLEFKKTMLIENSENAIPANSGTIKFRGDATFRGNDGLGIDNSSGGFVRFSTTATFDDNGSQLEGFDGCNIQNDATSEISFRGDATFINTGCRRAEGSPVYNAGLINFYGKVFFNDNDSDGNGGAVLNDAGSINFRSAVEFNNNEGNENGGGIAVDGGDVTFRKAVTFSGNRAASGGAFAVLVRRDLRTGEVVESGVGSLTFEMPSAVTFENNSVFTGGGDNDCTVGEVEEGTTLVGFPGDDVCVSAT